MSNSLPSKQPNVKQLRSIGHRLKPVVTVAQRGLTEAVSKEIDRALSDHELIKISVKSGTRQERQVIIETICEQCHAELIQTVGHVALILRRNDKPNPRLSNLLR
jgi:RNA-binding protein